MALVSVTNSWVSISNFKFKGLREESSCGTFKKSILPVVTVESIKTTSVSKY